jgi:hypothetical protein
VVLNQVLSKAAEGYYQYGSYEPDADNKT